MQATDRAEFVRVLNGLASIKRVQLTTDALEIWWLSIGSTWQLSDFKKAAAHLVTSCQFMPSPYDFAQLRRAGESTSHEAWTIALNHWRTPNEVPADRIIRAAASVGGFKVIAMANIERDLPHLQRRFLEAYDQLSDVEPVREALPQIVAAAIEHFGKASHQLPAPFTEKGGNLAEPKTFTYATLIENRA